MNTQPLAAALALAALLLAACVTIDRGPQPGTGPRDAAGLPIGLVTCGDVLAHPEARLFYPGSREQGYSCGDEIADVVDGRPHHFGAMISHGLDGDASPHAIEAWYTAWMGQHGWHTTGPATGPYGQQEQMGVICTRGTREWFWLVIEYNPGDLNTKVNGQHYNPVYQILSVRLHDRNLRTQLKSLELPKPEVPDGWVVSRCICEKVGHLLAPLPDLPLRGRVVLAPTLLHIRGRDILGPI